MNIDNASSSLYSFVIPPVPVSTALQPVSGLQANSNSIVSNMATTTIAIISDVPEVSHVICGPRNVQADPDGCPGLAKNTMRAFGRTLHPSRVAESQPARCQELVHYRYDRISYLVSQEELDQLD
jgi:hypothetical protein